MKVERVQEVWWKVWRDWCAGTEYAKQKPVFAGCRVLYALSQFGPEILTEMRDNYVIHHLTVSRSPAREGCGVAI